MALFFGRVCFNVGRKQQQLSVAATVLRCIFIVLLLSCFCCMCCQVMGDIDFKGKDWNSQIKLGQPGFYGAYCLIRIVVSLLPGTRAT